MASSTVRDPENLVLKTSLTSLERVGEKLLLIRTSPQDELQVNPSLPFNLSWNEAANFAVNTFVNPNDEEWAAFRREVIPQPLFPVNGWLAKEIQLQDPVRLRAHRALMSKVSSSPAIGNSLEIPPLKPGDGKVVLRFATSGVLILSFTAEGKPVVGAPRMSGEQLIASLCAILAHPMMEAEEQRLKQQHQRELPRYSPFLYGLFLHLTTGAAFEMNGAPQPAIPKPPIVNVPEESSLDVPWSTQVRQRFLKLCQAIGLPPPTVNAHS
jgi:hypothetical protein